MRLLPALALPLLLLTACSGSDGAEPDPRAEFVTAAEQVCAAANEQVEQIGSPASVAEVPGTADELVQVVRDTVEQVTALELPAEDADELRAKVLDPLRADVPVAEAYAAQLRTAADAGDGAALLRLVQERPQTSADLAFMREYGLVDCAALADQTD